MYKDFCTANPEKKLSYSKFFSVFKSMRISITELCNEECEKCEQYKQHKKECSCQNICDVNGFWSEYLDHISDAIKRRNDYIVEKTEKREVGEMKISVDLQFCCHE